MPWQRRWRGRDAISDSDGPAKRGRRQTGASLADNPSETSGQTETFETMSRRPVRDNQTFPFKECLVSLRLDLAEFER